MFDIPAQNRDSEKMFIPEKARKAWEEMDGQLFDLKNDPGETVNLYPDPAYRENREELLWELSSRRFEQTDPLPSILSQW